MRCLLLPLYFCFELSLQVEALCLCRLLAVLMPAVSVMSLALTLALTLASTLALTLVISSGGGIMLMSTASCAHACCECDVLGLTLALTLALILALILAISLGGGIMLMSTPSFAQSGVECVVSSCSCSSPLVLISLSCPLSLSSSLLLLVELCLVGLF